MTNTHRCETCGVEVATVKGVVRALSREYANGVRYLRGVHRCNADEVAAEREALARKDRQDRVLARYYGLLQAAVADGRLAPVEAGRKHLDAITRLTNR